MLQARTLTVSIECHWRVLYERIWRPEFFPEWASGLALCTLRKEGDRWLVQGPEGSVRIRFSDRNPYGVMDHLVEKSNGQRIYVPLRVVPNGDGAEVMLTLVQQPDMDDEKFASDIEWATRDLERLKSLIEGSLCRPDANQSEG